MKRKHLKTAWAVMSALVLVSMVVATFVRGF
jgi:hypothetical protein